MNTSFSNDSIITKDQVINLKEIAVASDTKTARINLHQQLDQKSHCMIIYMCKTDSPNIHRHHDKQEFIHIVEGEVIIKVYDEHKKIIRTTNLAPFSTGTPFIARIDQMEWHSIEPANKYAIFSETTSGPFIKDEMEIWS